MDFKTNFYKILNDIFIYRVKIRKIRLYIYYDIILNIRKYLPFVGVSFKNFNNKDFFFLFILNINNSLNAFYNTNFKTIK